MKADLTSMFSIALSLFIVIDAIGNIPFFVALLKEIDQERQKHIILREMVIALIIIILFNFLGEGLLSFLNISQDTVKIAGGVVLFLLSLKMLFPGEAEEENAINLKKIAKEPFIVPLAVPLIAGPAVLAMVMLYAHQEQQSWIMMGGIFTSWLASLLVLLFSPKIGKILGEKGVLATERLMGFIMILISVQMFMNGISNFIKS